MALVGTEQINNVDVEIHASQYGTWTIREKGVEGSEGVLGNGDTVEKAKNNARTELNKRKVKVAVNFYLANGYHHGIAHGIHGRTRKILAKVGSKAMQLDSYTGALKGDTPKDVRDHLRDIDDEISKLQREKREIVKQWNLDLSRAVDTAIKEAIEAKEAKSS